MKKIINLFKPVGMTPLQTIERFKEENSKYKGIKMGYAGKLDPMAEGVLLILVGDEGKRIYEYTKLDKEYRAKILFGVSTDSYDILGIPKIRNRKNEEIDISELKKRIKSLKGGYEQEIPIFSSKFIKYARKNKKIELPKKTIKIKEIQINSITRITSNKLFRGIVKKIGLLKGNFRQNKILEKWRELLEYREEKYTIVDLTISCSSGTYIRAIANDLGEGFGGGILLNLFRTRVGKFELKDSLRLKHHLSS